MAKKPSGWQRRKLLKQGVKPNRRGRPYGPVKLQLYKDLVHEVYVHHPAYAKYRKKGLNLPRPLIVRALREYRPRFYRHLNDRTLSRYVGEALRGIFAPRSRTGANFMQTILRR
jgi:hypothetical protein